MSPRPFKLLLPLFILSKNNAIVAALSYFLTITLANYLGPDHFGIYSHALIVASVVSIFMTFGTDQTAAVFHSHYGNVGDVFNNIYCMRLWSALPICIILIFLYFNNWEFLFFVICLLLTNYNLAFLYEIRRRNERYSYVYMFERGAYVSAAFFLIWLGYLSLVYLFSLLFFVTAASISYQLIDNTSVLRYHTKLRPRLIHQTAKESAPLVVVALSTFAFGGFSRLVLEAQLGSVQLGIYSAGWQLITIGTIFQAQVSRLWRVEITDSVYALDVKGLYRIFYSYFLLSTLPMIFVCCAFIFFSDRIISVLFTSSYAEVVKLLPIFGLYLIVINVAGLMDMLWVSLRKSTIYMLANLLFGLLLLAYLRQFSSNMGIVEFATCTVVFHSVAIIALALLWVVVFRARMGRTRSIES